MADYWMKFGENKTVSKVVVPPSPVKKTPVKKTPVEKPVKKKDDAPTHNTSSNQHNPFRHSNISNLKSFTGQNTGGNFQQSSKKSNVQTGDNTHQLMALYGLSTVVGFAGLKIASMIL